MVKTLGVSTLMTQYRWSLPTDDAPDRWSGVVSPESDNSNEQYTHVILLTAKSQKSEMIEGLNAGADDFIAKPFDKRRTVRTYSGGQNASL